MDAAYNKDAIFIAVRKQLDHGFYKRDALFGDGTAGIQIADLLASVNVSIQKSITY